MMQFLDNFLNGNEVLEWGGLKNILYDIDKLNDNLNIFYKIINETFNDTEYWPINLQEDL